jgi:hypothetical protein
MGRIRHLHVFLAILFPLSLNAQTNTPAFYWYQGKKILLKRAENTVAAKVLTGVDYKAKFPWLAKYFASVGGSNLRTEPVLLKASTISMKKAEDALASGIRSHELYNLGVFEVGKAKLIVQNEIIVQFKSGDTTTLLAEALLAHFSKTFVRQPGSGLRYLVRVPNPASTLALADMLYRNNTVLSAEPNFVIVRPAGATRAKAISPATLAAARSTTPPATFPSDPFFSSQWGLTKVGAPNAWKTTHGSAAIRIAVLDDGVDVTHADLRDKIDSSFDMLRNTSDMAPPSEDGHGTMVAGVAAATTNNAYGVAGLAPDVKLIPIRMESTVPPDSAAVTTINIVNSFEKAVELGADVINCSWSMPTPSDDVASEIEAVSLQGRAGKGAVIVFAAGDDGNALAFPANLSVSLATMAVGASNEWDEFATYSNHPGEDDWASAYGDGLTVVAPGVHITTTVHSGSVSSGTPPFTDDFWGTSAAAPFVSGLAALILSVNPALSSAQVRSQIANSADMVIKDPTGTVIGRINACKALGRADCG